MMLLFALCALFFACTERMEIDVDDAPPHLIIYGHITTDAMRHAVTVSRSLNYFENALPEGVSHATVTILTEGETYVLEESPTEKGTYLTAPGVAGVEGKTYTLRVETEFNGVRGAYEASSWLPPAIRMDSVALQASPLASYLVDVLLYGRLPESERNYLNVQAFRNDTAINGRLADFSIIASENATEKELCGEPCLYLFTENDNSELMSQGGGFTPIEEGDLIRIQVSSITKEYAEYVLNAQKELQGAMPIFSGPPANVKSNIKAVNSSGESTVYGFFTAYSTRSSSTVFKTSK
jgi:hypothetical protein